MARVKMDDTLVDFDFSYTEQEPLDAANDPFGGVNFDDPLDGTEICFDLPPLQQNPDHTPDHTEFPATLPEQLAEPVPSILEPSVGIYSEQPQYVNLDQVSSVPQQPTSFISPGYVPTNDTGITWTVVEKQILDSLPKPNELAYNLPLYDPQGYTSLPPMTTQFSTQPMFPPQYPINLGYQPPYVPQPQHQPRADPPVPRPPLDGSRSSRIPSRSPNRTGGTMPSRFPPSPKSITTNSPPLKRPEKNHNGELLRNDKIPRVTHRNKGPEAVEPELYYGPSPPKPQPWGPKNDKGEYLFTYTEKGELAPGKFFTQKQMRYYLMGPKRGEIFEAPRRLKGVKAKHGLRREGLILWIGWPAAMANSRYPRGGESTKCRFADCQYSQTIKVGEPWVIFDERQNLDGEAIDPFHNAGYCHLYCLEFHFDIIELSNYVEVKPDYHTDRSGDMVAKRDPGPTERSCSRGEAKARSAVVLRPGSCQLQIITRAQSSNYKPSEKVRYRHVETS
ncbi:hypothetical protein HD806DRAFT_8057 [Xylariaceae sp. AK1471]|nr:hypothetical protein HD806DRAFT_8057 [Xylariaceae sp. AK1471]